MKIKKFWLILENQSGMCPTHRVEVTRFSFLYFRSFQENMVKQESLIFNITRQYDHAPPPHPCHARPDLARRGAGSLR